MDADKGESFMNRHRALRTAAVVLVATIGIGMAFTANMAFKLLAPLYGPASSGGVGVGKQTLALPYKRKLGVNNAHQLMLDIGGGTITPVASISRFNTANDAFQVYTGRMGSPAQVPFALAPGEGYFVSMNSNTNYVAVGVDDSTITIPLLTAGAGSVTGKHLVALPYNATAKNAFQLMFDIGNGSIVPVASVSRFVGATDGWQVYTGRMGSPVTTPFQLVPGEAYLVHMNTTVSAYRPSHY